MPISIDDLDLPLRGSRGWDVTLRNAFGQFVDAYNEQEAATEAAVGVISGAVDANDATIAAAVSTAGTATEAALVSTLFADRLGVETAETVTYADVQAAATLAASTGRRLWVAGTLTTDQTLTVTSDADLGGLTINYTGTGVAVQVGVDSGVTFRINVVAPRVVASNKSGIGWGTVAGTVGVRAVNLNSCAEVVIPYVNNFETGLLVYGKGTGNSYNTYLIGHLSNNKVNLKLSGDATGWSNQNTYLGGRFSHNSEEGTNVSGVHHIFMDVVPNPVNTNTFIAPSIEADIPEFHAVIAGTANVLFNARWEASPAKIKWVDNSSRNLVLWGYNVHLLEETLGTSADTNIILGSTQRISTSSSGPIVSIENRTSSANAALAVMEAGARQAGANPTTAYAFLVGAQGLRGKRAADAAERLRVDNVNGRVYFGNGTATPTMYLGQFGTSGIQFNAANIVFTTDNANDIGGAGANRPRYVRAGTAVQTGAVATGSRPAAATAGAGAMVFDTTLGKPIWSTGSAWVDATGATV